MKRKHSGMKSQSINYLTMIPNYKPERINFDPEDIATVDFLSQWTTDNQVITAHTSGSTGRPKDIYLLKSDMIRSAESTCEYFGIDENSLLVCPLSADYIAGKMMIVRAIVSGATLYMIKPSNQPQLPDVPQIDLLPIVPSQIDGVVESLSHSNVKNIIIGGAPLSPAQFNKVCELENVACFSTYGMTETCSHVALRRISPGNDLYEGLPGYTFETDSRECLVIDNDDCSYKRLVTNDIVDLVSPSSFKWMGRYDNVIISGGLKIHPEDIEQKISGVLDCPFFITGTDDEKWGKKIVLTVEGEQCDTTKLEDYFVSHLKPHERPRQIIFVDRLPRTENGKIKRHNH